MFWTTTAKRFFRKRVATRIDEGYDAILERLSSLYQDLCRKIQGSAHTLGIGTPGSISPRTGLMRNSNTLALNRRRVVEDLNGLLGHNFTFQNDANCFTLAEALQGSGKGKNFVFGVILGTGCGGGMVLGGDILHGLQGIAGEWGHMSVQPDGVQCYCGAKGCVETLISGGGLERRYAAASGHHIRVPDIVKQYRAGQEPAVRLMREYISWFGRSLANLINVLDPDIVVLGGGLSNIDELYTEGVQEVKRQIFCDDFQTPIVRNQLGDSSGVIGAALLGT